MLIYTLIYTHISNITLILLATFIFFFDNPIEQLCILYHFILFTINEFEQTVYPIHI